MKAKVVSKSAPTPKTVVVAPGPKAGTREYRDQQRKDFDVKFEAAQKRQK